MPMTLRVSAIADKLRSLARVCDVEAGYCQASVNDLDRDGVHGKNAKKWLGRARTCRQAIDLLASQRRSR